MGLPRMTARMGLEIAGRARNDMGSMKEDGKNSGVAAVFPSIATI